MSHLNLPRQSWRLHPALGPALVSALLLAAGCACAHQPVNAPESAAMPAPTEVSTTVAALATLEAGFDYQPMERVLRVRYRLDNTGADALAVFDRGDRHMVQTRQLAAGDVPSPFFAIDGAGGLTLSHEALPLPMPAPTSPPTPLAARLMPGAALEAVFSFALPTSVAAERVRWCVGVAPFNDADFREGETAAGVDLWRASFAVVDDQQRLCTPWFDLAGGRFIDGEA